MANGPFFDDKFAQNCEKARRARGWTKKKFAREVLGIEGDYFSKLYYGHKPITEDMKNAALEAVEGNPISAGVGAGTTNVASTTGKEDDVTELYRIVNRLRDRLDELEKIVHGGQEKKHFKSGTH
jgi:hypothetical protein